MAVSWSDLDLMTKWGRQAARNDPSALRKAAEYLAMASDDVEYTRLYFWWNEGVRNNVDQDEDLLRFLNKDVQALAKQLGLS